MDKSIKLFNNKLRVKWDIIIVLTKSLNPRKYWSVFKTCLKFKLESSDGKFYKTDEEGFA